MFVLKSEITIGNYVFRSVHDVEIIKSVDDLSDTAVIKFPRNFKLRNDGKSIFTEDAIKPGDPVTILLGYEGRYEGIEFRGFVTKIVNKTPLEIHCEDFIYLLRRKNINKSLGKTTLKEILNEVVKDTTPKINLAQNIPDMDFSKFIIKEKNGAQVLQELKQDYLLSSFIDDDNKLYCGFIEGTNFGQKAMYDLNYNIVSNDLDVITEDSIRYLVKYSYINPKNHKTISVEVGDKDGDKRDYKTSIVSDQAVLKKMAEEALKQLKGNRLSGSITSFLIPFATRGMVAKIIDNDYNKISGNYFIRKVTTTYGLQGARRKVEISNRL